MPRTCNIDRRGRIARAICGVLTLGIGVVVLVLALRGGGAWWQWLLVGVLVLAGGFQLYEAHAGWCLTRALGLRTPM